MKTKRPAKRISEKQEKKIVNEKEEDFINLISEIIVNIIMEDDQREPVKGVQSKNTKSPKGSRTQQKTSRR